MKHLLFIIFLMLFTYSKIQAQLDPQQVDLLIKITLFKESLGISNTIDTSVLYNFLKVDLKAKPLKQEEFDDFDFYLINPDSIDTKNMPLMELPLVEANCDGYILAIAKGSNEVFRLKGFDFNDFASLFEKMSELNYPSIQTVRKFVYWYYVENLDLECIYRAYKSHSFNTDKYPCLKKCSELSYIE